MITCRTRKIILAKLTFLYVGFLANFAFAQVSGGLPPLPTTTPSASAVATVPLAPVADKLVQETQTALNQKGFNAGLADGFIGPQTQAAISSAQRALGLPVTGIPSESQLTAFKGLPELKDARLAYERKDYGIAFQISLRFAQSGNAIAQTNTAFAYFNGQGVAQNYSEALSWYRLAAAQGNAYAQGQIGFAYAQGIGVVQNYAEAVKWFKLGAAQGDSSARANLGSAYANGQGVVQDYVESVKWNKLAAAQGNAEAQVGLGFSYAQGLGTPQDLAEAIKWFKLSAAQGHANGQANLGVSYEMGNGVPQDFPEAAKWFKLAAAQGLTAAKARLDNLYKTGRLTK